MGLGLFIGAMMASTSSYLSLEGFDTTIPILAGLLIGTFLLIRFEAKYHAYRIEVKRMYIDHNLAFLRRIVVGVLYLKLFYLRYPPMSIMYEFILLAIVLACWWGIVFNYTLNIARGKPALYVSKSRDRPSLVDKIFSKFKHPGEYLLLTELMVGILAGVLYSYLVTHRTW